MAGRTAARRIPDPEVKRRVREQMERERSARRRRRWLWIGTPTALAATVTMLIVLLPHRGRGPTPPQPVSKVAENKSACLLTDPGQPAAPTVLAGMAAAAKQIGAVNTQQITLPASATDAAPSLAGLLQRHCTAVVALGPLSTAAADAAALNKETGSTRLAEVTDRTTAAAGVTVIGTKDLSSGSVASVLVAILG